MQKFYLHILNITIITLLPFSNIISESFIAQRNPNKKSPRRASVSQLKQNILEQLAELVKIEAQIAEVNAKIQSRLFNDIQILTENNRDSWINKLKQEELERYSNKLKTEQIESITRMKQAEHFLNYISLK